MIFWRGLGFLVPVITFVFMFGFAYLAEKLFPKQMWAFPFAVFLPGLVCWLLGKKLAKGSDRKVIDKATGKELVLRSSHSFMFIPIHYCGLILMIFAAVLFVLAIFKI